MREENGGKIWWEELLGHVLLPVFTFPFRWCIAYGIRSILASVRVSFFPAGRRSGLAGWSTWEQAETLEIRIFLGHLTGKVASFIIISQHLGSVPNEIWLQGIKSILFFPKTWRMQSQSPGLNKFKHFHHSIPHMPEERFVFCPRRGALL